LTDSENNCFYLPRPIVGQYIGASRLHFQRQLIKSKPLTVCSYLVLCAKRVVKPQSLHPWNEPHDDLLHFTVHWFKFTIQLAIKLFSAANESQRTIALSLNCIPSSHSARHRHSKLIVLPDIFTS